MAETFNKPNFGSYGARSIDGQKRALTPDSASQKEAVIKMEQGVITDPLLAQYDKVDLSSTRFIIYTIASMFLYASAMEMANKESIDICGLLSVERDHRVSEEAEKQGNINAVVRPGPIIDAILNRTNPKLRQIELRLPGETHSLFIPVQEDYDDSAQQTLLKIQALAAKRLIGYKYGLIPENWLIYLLSFLAIKHATLTLVAEAMEKGTSFFNFADMIEMKVDKVGDTFKMTCKPGKEYKLEIKSDNVTEVD